jgi:hypothetical protein
VSHIVTIDVKVFDLAALKAACARLSLAAPVHGTAQLFSSKATGYCVQLPNWRYPAVFNLETGEAAYDTFHGRWGEQAELHKLIQAYACEKAKIESRKQGHSVTEQLLADGSIKLTIQVGGAA